MVDVPSFAVPCVSLTASAAKIFAPAACCKPTFPRATVIQQHGSARQRDSSSQVGKKGACQLKHSGQPSGCLAAPTAHGHLATALQFLIANLELEFNLSNKRISKLKISNRKYMTIFHSENWAASEVRRLPQANSWHKGPRSQSCRKFPWPPWRLIATFDISEIESTCRKQTPKQISNSNKNAFFASREILRNALSAVCPFRATTLRTSSSHA